MKKKAGTFFKSVISKGKGLFKKENPSDSQQDQQNQDVDYGTEEDNDIIEVGKQALSKLPTQLLDFTGSTLSAADQYLHGSNAGNG